MKVQLANWVAIGRDSPAESRLEVGDPVFDISAFDPVPVESGETPALLESEWMAPEGNIVAPDLQIKAVAGQAIDQDTEIDPLPADGADHLLDATTLPSEGEVRALDLPHFPFLMRIWTGEASAVQTYSPADIDIPDSETERSARFELSFGALEGGALGAVVADGQTVKSIPDEPSKAAAVPEEAPEVDVREAPKMALEPDSDGDGVVELVRAISTKGPERQQSELASGEPNNDMVRPERVNGHIPTDTRRSDQGEQVIVAPTPTLVEPESELVQDAPRAASAGIDAARPEDEPTRTDSSSQAPVTRQSNKDSAIESSRRPDPESLARSNSSDSLDREGAPPLASRQHDHTAATGPSSGAVAAQINLPNALQTAEPPQIDAPKSPLVPGSTAESEGDEFVAAEERVSSVPPAGFTAGQVGMLAPDRAAGANSVPSQGGGSPNAAATQIAQQILGQLSEARAFASSDGNDLTVVIDHEDLGSLRIHVRTDGAALTLAVAADRADAADFMRRHLDLLQDAIREQGFMSLDVGVGQGDGQAGRESQEVNRFENNLSEIEQPNTVMPQSRRLGHGGLDIRM